jgi:hypothetical protein
MYNQQKPDGLPPRIWIPNVTKAGSPKRVAEAKS